MKLVSIVTLTIFIVALPLLAIKQESITLSEKDRLSTKDAEAIKKLKKKIQGFKKMIEENPDTKEDLDPLIWEAKRKAFEEHNLKALRALKGATLTCYGTLCGDNWAKDAAQWRMDNPFSTASNCYLDMNHNFKCTNFPPKPDEVFQDKADHSDVVSDQQDVWGEVSEKNGWLFGCMMPVRDINPRDGVPYWGLFPGLLGGAPSTSCVVCKDNYWKGLKHTECALPMPNM